MLKMFGISNCSTVKKSRVWLESHQIEYEFHDYKKAGVPEDLLDVWLKQFGWEALVNRKGTTWRKLDPTRQAQVKDADSAKAVMMDFPSIIKRPLLSKNRKALLLGFNEEEWGKALL